MIQPATVTLTVNRFTPAPITIEFTGIDLTGATMDMHVRLTPDTPGSPLINLSPAVAGSEGLSVTVDDSGDLPVSTIAIEIDEGTLEALPAADEIGNDAEFWWDLQITPAGLPKAVYFRGPFIVRAGVTQ